MKLLNDKVAIITGGSRGIGESIVRSFIEQGAHVAFTYVSSNEKANQLVEELKDKGPKINAYRSDASSFEQAASLVEVVLNDFEKIDILVNNAGITRDNLLLRMDEESWDSVIETNLKSVFNLTKQVIRPMIRARAGSIINVSSIVGVSGNAGQANYAASKAGIIGFTKSIAKEVGSRNVRCNAIAPGFIETDMTNDLDETAIAAFAERIPLNRLGSGEDVANATLYLASEMSNYVSGQVISVCGALNT